MGDRRRLNSVLTWVAMAQACQGHTDEAARTIAPLVKSQRELATRNRGDSWQPVELAAALYVQALTDPMKREAILREAAALIEGLASEVRATHDVRQWRERVRSAFR